MNREIKFRAWNRATKHMIMLGGPPKLKASTETHKLVFGDDFHDDFYEGTLDDYELMQFTGLKDKEGKDIYEGDIVCVVEGSPLVVNWGDFHDCCVEGQTWMVGDDEKNTLADFAGYGISIIGNIYEHSELLREKENV